LTRAADLRIGTPFAHFPRANGAGSTHAGESLFANPVRIKRDTCRIVKCARKFVEQRKKECLFTRCEGRQHAGVGFARRLGEFGKQFLAGPCQLQAMPPAVVNAD
jgi:hypothetical protein